MNATTPITLADLSPRTRDWLLAKSAHLNVPPMQALNETLDNVARRELKPVGPVLASSPVEEEAAATNKEGQP